MFKNYIKIAWRNLLKNRSFTIVNIIGLSVGMASAALILLWIGNEVSFDKFHNKGDRLVMAYNHEPFNGVMHDWYNTPSNLGPVLKSNYSDIEETSRITDFNYLFSVGEKHINEQGSVVDPGFLTMFNFPLIKGNNKTALSNPDNIVITQDFAKKLFGTVDAVGKVLRIDSNANFTVSGVMENLPNNTRFKFSYLLPWAYLKTINRDEKSWTNNSTYTYALLKKDAPLTRVNQEIKDLIKSNSVRKDNQLFFYPVSKWHLYERFENGKNAGGRIDTVKLFAIIAAFILLIACINFMNLSTARSEKRAKEVGIRKVAGAPKAYLIGQFLAESIMIAFMSGIIALAIIHISLPAFNQLTEKQLFIPFTNGYFWCIAIGFTLLTGLLAGSYPAFYLSSFKPVAVLKGTFKAANALIAPRKILVVTQFTFAITLIICTIIVRNQIHYAQSRELGYKRDNLAYTMISGDINKHYTSIRQELLASGAVTGVTKTNSPITEGWSDSWNWQWKGSDPSSKIDFRQFNTDGDFVKTMGVKLIAGRDIDTKTYPTDSLAIILNASAVKVMNLTNPIGETIKGQGKTWHVVGVLNDFIVSSPYSPVEPMIMMGPSAWFNVIHYKLNPVRSTADNLAKIEQVFKKFNPEYPFEYHFVDQEYAWKFSDEQRLGSLATVFAGLTIIISCLGLFGLATYMAQNRIKEIGVRKVLGASVTNITTLLSTDFVKLIIIAFVIAAPIAWFGMNRWLQQYNYHTGISIWVFVGSAFTTIVIALLTVSYQSIKAAIANPVKSLRSE